jgi:hypothetical protein
VLLRVPSKENSTRATPALPEAVAETVTVPETVAPEAGAVIETVGGAVPALFTVIETAALVAVCALALLATAVSEWLALESVAVFREKLNGALVTAAPALLPSTLNCTLVVFADTLVETAMVPETVAPEVGAEIEIVGGVDTLFLTVIATAALVLVCALALLATAVSEWLALESVAVFKEKLNGALVTAAPALLPSTLNCTLVVFADTLVESAMVPETVAPEVGDEIKIVGGVDTLFLTVIATAALAVVCAAALLATAVSEWPALESVAVFKEKVKGALVTAAPALLPSTLNCTLVVFAETIVETVTVPETVAPEAGDEMDTVGGAVAVFLTVIATATLVVVCAAALLATAVNVWLALESVAVFKERLKGALLTAAPELLPSTLNCTLVVFAETIVETVTVPETVAPEVGAEMETVGGADTLFFTVIATAALVVVCAAASLATAVSEWLALESVAVFKERLNGARLTAAPESLPSTLNCTLVVFAETIVETVTVPETVAPEVGDEIDTVGDAGAVFLVVIATAALVVVCALMSLATAVSEWLPLESVAVFKEKLKGALVTAAPESLPSTLNCTLVVFAETLVAIAIVPETVAPEIGDEMDTVGGVLAAFLTVIATAALVVVNAAALLATAVSEWLALESVAVFKEKLKGALVTAPPIAFPSIMNCTAVVFADTFVETSTVPETVAPEVGDVTLTVGAEAAVEFLLLALVRPTHPVHSSDRITGR